MKRSVTLSIAILFFTYSSFAEKQVIGSFPQMDGGFEDQAAGTFATQSSIASGSQYTYWTKSAGTASTTASGGRSGPKYVTLQATAATRFQSPTCANGAIVNATSYVQQYYYRTAGATAPAAVGQAGHSPDGTLQPGSYAANNLSGTSGVWTKKTVAQTSGTSAASPKYGIGIIRCSASSTIAFDVDDFVVYAGSAADTTAPNPPTSFLGTPLDTSADVSWTAPSGGVDGGGYVAVRGTADPTTVPNANGIYAVGNTIGAGTVVYIGTATSCEDQDLSPNTPYYYRIYAVDKAFNYSTALTGSITTTPEPGACMLAGLLLVGLRSLKLKV